VAGGEARVVLGTRSAVFAPLVSPGLIVVDEEQDTSFKQEERPRYQARDLALVRAQREGATVVLGSATPSLESYHRARKGKYRLLQLEGRVGDRPLARAEVIDMRAEFREVGRARALSRALVDGLQDTLGAGHQSVLLLNRRGYATFLLCRDCGELSRCPSCSVSLVLHRGEGRMRCHYCGHARPVPETCDACGGRRLRSGAEGTERLEELLAGVVPDARVVRLDRDTVRRRGEAERILSGFGRGDWDILLGTQMVAKGHDYPRVTLVGVLAAEGTLGLPDFRAAERTFQLLTQVAGRSGRGDAPGRVLIQTFQPDHYAVRHACSQDYEGFYEEEVRFRRLLQYPPFTVLANLIVSRTKLDTAVRQGEAVSAALRVRGGAFLRVLGPAPAPLSRLRGLYRVQILLKARARGRLADAIRWALDRTESAGFPRRHVSVDMDPASLL
jgi:primosomal protein N' (replication factor Y)